jgi:hypothetical protein
MLNISANSNPYLGHAVGTRNKVGPFEEKIELENLIERFFNIQ